METADGQRPGLRKGSGAACGRGFEVPRAPGPVVGVPGGAARGAARGHVSCAWLDPAGVHPEGQLLRAEDFLIETASHLIANKETVFTSFPNGLITTRAPSSLLLLSLYRSVTSCFSL